MADNASTKQHVDTSLEETTTTLTKKGHGNSDCHDRAESGIR